METDRALPGNRSGLAAAGTHYCRSYLMAHDTGTSTSDYRIEDVLLHAQPVLAVHGTVTEHDIGDFLGTAFARVTAVVNGDGMHVCGPPFARVHPTAGGRLEVEAGYPVTGAGLGQGDVAASHLPGGHALRTMHRGGWAQARLAHLALHEYASEHHLTPAGDAWEVYLDGPGVAQPRTMVVLPTRPPGDAAAAAD